MKKYILPVLAALMLTSCGDTSNIDKMIENSEAAETATTASGNTTTEVTLSPADQAVADQAESMAESYFASQTTPQPSQIPDLEDLDVQNGDIDIDLTGLSSNMIYAQMFNITSDPDKYTGKKMRVKGYFSYTTGDNGKEYFAVIIPDALACCSQGLEFVRDGDYTYPDDYPKLDEEITITGYFDSYKEGIYTYCELTDAVIEEA